MKKAVIEMLVMLLLSRQDMHSLQITKTIEERSDNMLSLSFPYALLYRLMESGYIREAYKKTAPDGRRRQYFQITEAGRGYLTELLSTYRRFCVSMDRLLEEGEENHGE